MDAEVDLMSETNAVHRHGSVVMRNAGPHSSTVHCLLRHLEEVGFAGAPRVVGTGFDSSGRETLSFIEGEIMQGRRPTMEAASAVGRIVRELHDATASFVPPPDAVWQPWFGRRIGNENLVIGHCDVAPWNVVTRDGMPIALIDWELAGPVDPIVELAQAAWLNARLYSDDVPERDLLPSADERARQFRAVVDAYELPAKDRTRFVDTVVEFAIHSVAADADQYSVTPDTGQSPALWGMTWRARSASWMLRHRSLLARALE